RSRGIALLLIGRSQRYSLGTGIGTGRRGGDVDEKLAINPGCTALTAHLVLAPPEVPQARWSPSRRRIQTAPARKLSSKFDGMPETINPRLALHPSPRDSRQLATTDPRLSNRRVD